MFVSYAQNFEDVLLNRVFKNQEKGFYIDIGANHPTYESVTKAFYEKGWRGINIEPVPDFFQQLSTERKEDINLNIAIGEKEEELTFYELIGSGFSTLDEQKAHDLINQSNHHLEIKEYQVQTTTLAQICEEYICSEIDFFKIDVEGWEETVILSNNWQKFRPKIVIVEATIPDSNIRKVTEIENILSRHSYYKVFFDGLNDFYLAEEYLHFQQFFTTPVNIFDQFISYQQVDLKKQVTLLKESNLEAKNYINSLQESLDTKTDELKKQATLSQESDLKLNTYINSLQENLSHKINELESLQKNLQQKNLDLIKMQEVIKNNEDIVNELGKDITNLKTINDNLNKENQLLELNKHQLFIAKNRNQDLKQYLFYLEENIEKQRKEKEAEYRASQRELHHLRAEISQKYSNCLALQEQENNDQQKTNTVSENLARKETTTQEKHDKEISQQLHDARNVILAMESSKFWKLRSIWFKIKKLIGLPIN